jgi:hypothetical protein
LIVKVILVVRLFALKLDDLDQLLKLKTNNKTQMKIQKISLAIALLLRKTESIALDSASTNEATLEMQSYQ